MAQTILVIEDDESSRSLYAEILADEHYNVVETEDGQAALKYLLNHPNPQLIIMDLTFPNMTAKEFVAELKNRPQIAAIPYVFISGQVDIQETAKELRALTFLRKPFDLNDFITTVKKSL